MEGRSISLSHFFSISASTITRHRPECLTRLLKCGLFDGVFLCLWLINLSGKKFRRNFPDKTGYFSILCLPPHHAHTRGSDCQIFLCTGNSHICQTPFFLDLGLGVITRNRHITRKQSVLKSCQIDIRKFKSFRTM